MTTTKTTATRWNRDERGSADRYQMRAYAYAVAVAMTGGTCPLTGLPMQPTAFEVDRVVPALGYVPGNVVAVTVEGNQGRAEMQTTGDDLPGVAAYRADVLAASATVEVPTLAEGKRIVQGWGKPSNKAIVLAGKYGK